MLGKTLNIVNIKRSNKVRQVACERNSLNKISLVQNKNIAHIDKQDFAKAITKYMGETVTVFAEGGGIFGRGITGVLIDADMYCIRILSSIGEAPIPDLGHEFLLPSDISVNNNSLDSNAIGSITEIPINKITAFVHNAISGF